MVNVKDKDNLEEPEVINQATEFFVRPIHNLLVLFDTSVDDITVSVVRQLQWGKPEKGRLLVEVLYLRNV